MEPLIVGVKGCLEDLRFIEEKNQRHEFKPGFWQQNADFTLGRDVLIAAAGSISNQVTKFSLVMGKEEVPKEALSVCQALYEPCQQLMSALKVSVLAGAGYALTKELSQSTHRILVNILELSNRMQHKDFARVPEFTGRIWDACTLMDSISKSNLIATKRLMLQTVSVLNDTVQELEQALAESTAESEATEVDVELQDDLDFDMDASLTPQEVQQLTLSIDVLKMTQAIAKKGVLALNSTASADGQDGFVQWGGAFPVVYDAIQTAVVDMGADLTPPFEADVVASHISALEKIGTDCLRHLLDQPGIASTADLHKGLKAFQDKVQACLAALHEETE
ncbi:unnamed protein product [Aphanomyces euteiches]|uniref:Cyclin-D1-binding protein 1-like N-terminal domain-containing protein n=1 Tax=Aphanomyces euteiches TaxID=100861 RepID=A0A6G0XNA1_9STRA|nr:hypothetical protein Ae201684_003066 [Aphanomyces euteiches]KAH9098395.1 hypothetical protein Ae201684P_017608 [Aphanomyces euteiches]KAH9101967.1 hypothetical protein LEN26_015622 [Aphanomyces euteiches]KAH9113182.1 hypothetical protein AeMF1_012595 [Aphanomyces euteiches]KAH9139718.1 hypothetical protein AeRB84_016022 [Aphanomyces euteiches]